MVETIRNNQATIEELMARETNLYVISPGPSSPERAGVSLDLVAKCTQMQRPLFSVCLGHQYIGQHFKTTIIRSKLPMHGKISSIFHEGKGVFSGLENPIDATRYHSLVIDPATLPAELEVTATSKDGVIQKVKHRTLPIKRVQFHPESVLTEKRKIMLQTLLHSL